MKTENQFRIFKSSNNKFLQIPNPCAAVAFGFEIILVFENERHDEIHDHGRAHREKGEINKIHPDSCWANSEFLSPPVANAKCALFKPIYDAIDEIYASHRVGLLKLIYKKKKGDIEKDREKG